MSCSGVRAVVALAAVMALAGAAQAADVTYSDRDAFDQAVGAQTLVDFNDVDVPGENYAYYESLTIDGVTFSTDPEQTAMFVMDRAYYYTSQYPEGHFLQLFYGEPVNVLTVSFAATRSFGFDFQHLSPPDRNPVGPFRLELPDGKTFEFTTPSTYAYNDPLAFFGLVSDQAFDHVTLYLPDFGAYNVTDNFRVGAPVGGGVPEPATWALLIAGFGLVGAGLRRRTVRVAMAVVAGLTLAPAASSAAENLVTNGGFEQGLTGWLHLGAKTTDPLADQWEDMSPTEGVLMAALGDNAGLGTLRQALQTQQGRLYRVSFDLAHVPHSNDNLFQVYWGTIPVLQLGRVEVFPFERYEFDLFGGAGPTTTLSFNYLHDDGRWLLDDVRVVAGVPEPGTWALAILGFGLAGARLRTPARADW